MPKHCCPKGRAIKRSQRCLYSGALPTQFTGDTDMTQQCLDHNSPRERSVLHRRSATTKTPLPTNHRSRHDHAEMPKSERSTGEANARTQQCLNKSASPNQLQGAILVAQKCQEDPAPTEFGPFSSRRNATNNAPNNQRPLKLRNNANSRSPRNIKRKTNGQEI